MEALYMNFMTKTITLFFVCLGLSQSPLMAMNGDNDSNAESSKFTMASGLCTVGSMVTGFMSFLEQSMGPWGNKGNAKNLLICSSALAVTGLVSSIIGYNSADTRTQTGRNLASFNLALCVTSLGISAFTLTAL